MSNIVIESLAEKYERVRKGVGEVMGGEILETEAKKILEQGHEEGSNDKAHEMANIMLAEGEPLEKIARYTGLSIKEIKRMVSE